MRAWLTVITLRTAVLLALAGCASIAFAAIADEVVDGDADAFDRALGADIRAWDSPVLDAVLPWFTHLGAWWFLPIAAALAAWFALRRGDRRAAIVMIGTLITAQGLNVTLKHLFARARPDDATLVVAPSTYSFPSGHAMVSAVVYGAICAVLVRDARRGHAAIIAATILLVLGLGFSRIYLGVHWPLDVIAGYLVAVPVLLAVLYLLGIAFPRRARRATTSGAIHGSTAARP